MVGLKQDVAGSNPVSPTGSPTPAWGVGLLVCLKGRCVFGA